MKKRFENIDFEIKSSIDNASSDDKFFSPSDNVWKGIKPHLPNKKRRNYFIWFFIFGVMIISAWGIMQLVGVHPEPENSTMQTANNQQSNKSDKAVIHSPGKQKSNSTVELNDSNKPLSFSDIENQVFIDKDSVLSKNVERNTKKENRITDARSSTDNNDLSFNDTAEKPNMSWGRAEQIISEINFTNISPTNKAKQIPMVADDTILKTRIIEQESQFSTGRALKSHTLTFLDVPGIIPLTSLMNDNFGLVSNSKIDESIGQEKRWYVMAMGNVTQHSFLTTSNFDQTFGPLEYFNDEPVNVGFGLGFGIRLHKNWYMEGGYTYSGYKLQSGHNSSLVVDSNPGDEAFYIDYELDLVTPLGTIPATVQLEAEANTLEESSVLLGFDNYQQVRQHNTWLEGGYQLPLSNRFGLQMGLTVQYSILEVAEQGVERIILTESRYYGLSQSTSSLSRDFWSLGGNMTAYYDWKQWQIFGRFGYRQSVTEVFRYEAGPLNQRNIGLSLGIRRFIF